MNFQSEKQIILDYYNAIESSTIEDIPKVLSQYCSEDLLWRGFHPFNEIRGAELLYSQFWQPYKKGFLNFQEGWMFF